MMPNNDIGTLPKWAQRMIANLQRTIAERDSALASRIGTRQLAAEAKPGQVAVRDVLTDMGRSEILLADDAHVRFYLPNVWGGRRPAEITVYHERSRGDLPSLAVHGDESAICVQHSSSNLFYAFYPKRR